MRQLIAESSAGRILEIIGRLSEANDSHSLRYWLATEFTNDQSTESVLGFLADVHALIKCAKQEIQRIPALPPFPVPPAMRVVRV